MFKAYEYFIKNFTIYFDTKSLLETISVALSCEILFSESLDSPRENRKVATISAATLSSNFFILIEY